METKEKNKLIKAIFSADIRRLKKETQKLEKIRTSNLVPFSIDFPSVYIIEEEARK